MTEPHTGAPEGSFRSAFDEMTQLVQRSRYAAAIVRRFLNQDREAARSVTSSIMRLNELARLARQRA